MVAWFCRDRSLGRARCIRAMAQEAASDAGCTGVDTAQDTGQRQSAPDVFAARAEGELARAVAQAWAMGTARRPHFRL